MRSRSPRAFILLSMCVFIAACSPSAPSSSRAQDVAPVDDSSHTQFVATQRLYNEQCAVCHGEHGRGDGPAAFLLYPKPRNFTQEEYRLISTDDMSATDEDLFRTITRGMPGSSMPPWEHVPEATRRDMVRYVRYLEEVGEGIDAGERTQAEVDAGLPRSTIEGLITKHAEATSMVVPPEAQVTSAGLARGAEIYTQACAACHGATGRGDGQQAMEDNDGFPTRPRDLTAGIFKGSSSSEDLYFRIMAGLPGSPMPSYAGAYSETDVWHLVHYVQSLVPEGVEERVGAYQQTIQAQRVNGPLTTDPYASVWNTADVTYVAVTPLWWRDERIPGVEIQAAHNGEQIAVKVSWDDASRNQSAVRTEDFPDGLALQFSAQENPPFFGMGSAHGEVDIWHWKAVWEHDLVQREDVETTYPNMAVEYYPDQKNWEQGTHQENTERGTTHHDPTLLTGWGAGNPLSDPERASAAEHLRAQGQGTLTQRPPVNQRVQARGVWERSRWTVVLTNALATTGAEGVTLRPGDTTALAVAVWDGAANDRDGQKSYSIWHKLALD